MLRLVQACVLALALFGAAVSASLADHMNGSYSGTGEAAGTTLLLKQSGTTVTGEFSGGENGTLAGQSDGQHTVNGHLDADGVRYQFVGVWSQAGFEITLFDAAGNTDTLLFAPAGMAEPETPDTPETPETPQTPETPETPETPVVGETEYWVFDNGQQIGPMALQQVLDRIASGESNRQTEVWTADLNEWVMIDTVAELAAALPAEQEVPAATEYWVFDNDQQVGPMTLQQVLDRIASGESNRQTQVWTADLNQWVMIDTVAELATALPADQQGPTATEYWVFDNDQQIGPMTLQQVLERIASGESNRQTQVWTADLNQWVMIDTVAELAAALPAAQDPEPEQTASYYLYADGVQTGPFTRDQVLAGIAQGTVPRRSLIWQPGQADWARIETVAEFGAAFPPAVPQPVQYFVVENGQRVGPLGEEEMLARIAATITGGDDLAWKKGLEAWAPVSSFPEFEEALAALAAPPVPPILPEDETLPPEEDAPPPVPGAESDEPPMTPPLEPEAGADEAPPIAEPAVEMTDEPAGGAEEDLLVTMLRESFEREMPGDITAEEREDVVLCVAEVLEPISAEHRQMLIDAGLNPNAEQAEILRQAYPDQQAQLQACTDLIASDARSEVYLPDGRAFAVVGGNNHSVTSIEGGHNFIVDGMAIEFVDGALTVDGEAVDVPSFQYVLEVHVEPGGAFSVTADN